jgi:hypothetical protein
MAVSFGRLKIGDIPLFLLPDDRGAFGTQCYTPV